MTEERVLLGRITGVHGLKGEVKIATFTARPGGYRVLRRADRCDRRPRVPDRGHAHREGRLHRRPIRGVTDRDEAEQLRGTDLTRRARRCRRRRTTNSITPIWWGLKPSRRRARHWARSSAFKITARAIFWKCALGRNANPFSYSFDGVHVPHVDIAAGRVTIVRPVYEEKPSGGDT